MLRSIRVFLGIGVLVLILAAIPLSSTARIKGSFYSLLKVPVIFFEKPVKLAFDLYSFRKNAVENQALKNTLAENRFQNFQSEELRLENARLTKLLHIQPTILSDVHHHYFARVILRSTPGWNRVILIDKGTRQAVKPNMLVLSESSVVGKVVISGPWISQVLLITDTKSRIGAVIQRTRQAGLLFGTSAGQCHMKYLSIESEVKPGDRVETAGFGGFFPKGLPVGTVERVWKQPGQIYQTAEVKPFTDLNRIEEVVAID